MHPLVGEYIFICIPPTTRRGTRTEYGEATAVDQDQRIQSLPATSTLCKGNDDTALQSTPVLDQTRRHIYNSLQINQSHRAGQAAKPPHYRPHARIRGPVRTVFGLFTVLLFFLTGSTAANQVPANLDPGDPGPSEGNILGQAQGDSDELDAGQLAASGLAAANEHDAHVPMSRQLTVSGESYTALSNLYSSTGGAAWTVKTNWMSGDPCTAGWYVIFAVFLCILSPQAKHALLL